MNSIFSKRKPQCFPNVLHMLNLVCERPSLVITVYSSCLIKVHHHIPQSIVPILYSEDKVQLSIRMKQSSFYVYMAESLPYLGQSICSNFLVSIVIGGSYIIHI